jgi:hypothetical protein
VIPCHDTSAAHLDERAPFSSEPIVAVDQGGSSTTTDIFMESSLLIGFAHVGSGANSGGTAASDDAQRLPGYAMTHDARGTAEHSEESEEWNHETAAQYVEKYGKDPTNHMTVEAAGQRPGEGRLRKCRRPPLDPASAFTGSQRPLR